jgi:hypothetical protein
VYLKRAHGLAYVTYAATLVVTYVSAMALYGFVGLAGLAELRHLGREAPMLLWLAFGALAGSIVLFAPIDRLLPLPSRLHGLRQGLAGLRRHHLLGRIVLLQAALLALTTTGLWLACRTLPEGRDVSWATALMLGVMVLASGVINVTPGNVGVEQGAAELTARLLHVAPNVGFLASAIFRAVSAVVVLAIGPFFSAMLARRMK